MSFVMDNLGIESGELTIGGVKVSDLARKYGTPLYILDEDKIRQNCRDYVEALKTYYPAESKVLYASKAFCCKGIYPVIKSEGLGADVVSGGELFTACLGNMPGEELYFHGNNKNDSEIELALERSVHAIVVDSIYELKKLSKIAEAMGKRARVLFRVKPGVDIHTHEFVQTGQEDSKFGLSLVNGEAFEAFSIAKGLENIDIMGIHCHIGSQIFEAEGFNVAINRIAGFVREIKDKLNVETHELNLGGGQGIKYTQKDDPLPITEFAKYIALSVVEIFKNNNLTLPKLLLEPGRSIVGNAGITVYTVGSVKTIPNVRKYISVDGGMGDNPRYMMYGSEYEALRVREPLDNKKAIVTIVGKYCESGDVIIKDGELPEVEPEDLIAVQCTGAYNYSMASNYNRIPRPAAVIVSNGEDRILVRRESYENLVILDK